MPASGPMKVTFDPEAPIESHLNLHMNTPEARAEFDKTLTSLNAMQKTGKLGTNPDEQFGAISHVLQNKYPEMMRQSSGLEPEWREYLTNRGVMSPEPSFAQKYVQPAFSIAGETVGMLGGEAVGGPIGAGVGAAAVGGATDAASRYAFGMPQRSASEFAGDTASRGIVGSLFSAAPRFASRLGKSIFFGTPEALTPDALASINLISEGSLRTGNPDIIGATPGEGVLSRATRPGETPTPTWRTTINDFAENAVLSSSFVKKKISGIEQSLQAVTTDLARGLGQQGALLDSSIAANTIKDMHELNHITSREVRRAVYDGAYALPGAGSSFSTDIANNAIKQSNHRISFADMLSATEKSLTNVEPTIEDYLTTRVPVSLNTPANTPLVDYKLRVKNTQKEISATTNLPIEIKGEEIIPDSAVFLHMNPNNTAQIRVTLKNGGVTEIPEDVNRLVVRENTSNYKNLSELISKIGEYKQDMASQARIGQVNPSFAAAREREANFIIAQIEEERERAVTNGIIPRKTFYGFKLADKLASEEVDTFTNSLTNHIIEEMGKQPEKFAYELLQPHNGKTLEYIQKAVDSVPDIPFLTRTGGVKANMSGVTQAEFSRELARSSLYKKGHIGSDGRTIFESVIRPQMQAEYLRSSLKDQSTESLQRALIEGRAGATGPAAPGAQVYLNPSSLVSQLEADGLDPTRRRAIFGDDLTYNRWLTIAKTLQRYDPEKLNPKAGIGSFMVVSKQSAALQTAAGAALGGYAYGTDDPNKRLYSLVAGAGIFISPIILTRYINNPRTFRELHLALKQTPTNMMKTKIISSLVADSIEHEYRTLPGEAP